GSNLQALLDAERAERWATAIPARIVAAISSKPQAPRLAIAAAAGVATEVVESQSAASREAFDAALLAAIDRHAPDLVVLAGFMRVLTDGFVAHYAGRLVNIHPSLLPSFPGLAAHRQALAAGVRVHGCTVHFVSATVDSGAIVGQAAVPVRAGDTEDTLAARVLEQEHRLLPVCVRLLLEGRVRLERGRAVVDADVAERVTILVP
ncbi:MAG: phosphoribosylglycinamide formyltransferase, partial [Burkholderiales bacterium]|nr:phosphoribosylglycinamide formyltransferase [Burkholderiales bacterium]